MRSLLGLLAVLLIVVGTVALLALAIGLYDVGPEARQQACADACARVGLEVGAPQADGDCRCAPRGG